MTTTVAIPAVRYSTSHLLFAGALTGPVFFASVIAQMLTREGFDITRHPISQLSTGNLGWIQISTFVLAGAGALALAKGIRRTLTEGIGRRVLPLFVAIFGVGLIVAGLFPWTRRTAFLLARPRAGRADVLARHRSLGGGRDRLHRVGRSRHSEAIAA